MSDAGSVDENAFLASFDNIPHMNMYNFRDVTAKWKECYKIIENKDGDWKKRVKSLTEIRSLIIASLNYDEFHSKLRELIPAFDKPLKDLRSSVVREACITVAFLSKTLGNKLDYFAESALPDLFKLIQSSAKVMATSAIVCIRFILRYIHSPRLISRVCEPIFDQHSQLNKSKEIRKTCCEFVYLILQTWPANSIEKNQSAFSNLQKAIKKGLEDADGAARVHSRNAFQEFSNVFPHLAEGLAESLEDRSRKYLNSNSNSSSSSSLHRIPASTSTKGISYRSNSAIDLHVIKKVTTREPSTARSAQKASSSSVSKITPKTRTQPQSQYSQSSSQRAGRTKNRISISQPTSRAGSPNSGLSYTNYLCSSGNVSRSSRHHEKPTVAQKMLLQAREAEAKILASLSSPPLWCSMRQKRGSEDHIDGSETSSIASEQSMDSHRKTSDTSNGSPYGLYPDFRQPALKDIYEIIANCENVHWNERRDGLQSLQYYLQEGNRLELRHLKRVMDVFTKNFNDPHIKVFSLFLDSLNEVIRCHNKDLHYCLHLLLVRLFNKLGTDLLDSVNTKIIKTLDIISESFPADLQLHSAFRFLVDPTQTPNARVKLATLNYIVKLTSVYDPSNAFTTNTIDSSKDYTTMALEKIVSWTLDSSNVSSELRRVSRETILALFTLHPSEVARRFSTMPTHLEEAAVTICKNHCFSSENNDELKAYIEELSQSSPKDVSHREELLNEITSVVRTCPSEIIVGNFKPLLLTICGLLIPQESATVKVLSFNLLQTITEKKKVTDLLKNISDLVITKTIALVSDSSQDVKAAAENCAISLATCLPAESVIRVVVPLITSEDVPVKLVAIKMLTKNVKCSDGSTTLAEIDPIMNVLLTACNDKNSNIRKAVVFCMVALHEQSEEMKTVLEPYFNRLEKTKLKLVQLYIEKAEQGFPMQLSPNN